MTEAEALLQRYLKAQEDHDLDALVSCWHPEVEVVHPMRPDRDWSGLDTYRRQWALIWERRPTSRFEVVTSDVIGNRIYLEALTEMSDGTLVPHMNILELKDGVIFRARVYTDRPRRDGVTIDGYADEINPVAGPQK
ncbi:MAG TPA: nuclear transport factor 2 family protein [Acidimicrobiales bacterium]|nr:nuclear transport factor 2 family protein [Acidimicrobiales bacterium]